MNIAICDDDINVQRRIRKYLIKFFRESSETEPIKIDTFHGSFDLMDYIDTNKFQYDIIFMDIMLGRDNGIKVSEQIARNNSKVQIVFITSHIEFVEDIFDITPAGLLIKPITFTKVEHMITKLIKRSNVNASYITIKNKRGIYAIKLNDILYIESQLRYLIIYRQNDSPVRTIMNMAEMESMLNSDFIKCHRSYLVNCRKIKKLDRNYLNIINDCEIPVSSSKYSDVRAKYLHILGEL